MYSLQAVSHTKCHVIISCYWELCHSIIAHYCITLELMDRKKREREREREGNTEGKKKFALR